ncbi:glycosyltransferase [Nocardioides sp. zg-ZUI104]|uniref:glycosyltransferase n=1 Tax=Nocardioides faecalis TaxID=2803858 RepID=UPI001BCF2380|nr:glycosyltransferase [Nocardioides faecalis]MBS4753301.1 glycosyltransferase [Nocardioides faecalis]
MSRYGEICLAVYRPDPELLGRQLASIANQSHRSWTCHVAIDGHDPATFKLVSDSVGGDARFILHHYADNIGFYRNFERAVENVTPRASWVALSDQDDFWYTNKLERMISTLEREQATAVVCQARVVSREGQALSSTGRRSSSPTGLFYNNQVTGSLAVFRPDVVSLSLPFPPPTDAAYHDHWLGVCSQALGKIYYLEDVMQDYVQHTANVLGEERGNRLGRRTKDLFLATRRLGGVADYLAEHRWGWRVRMAREVLNRRPSSDPLLHAIAAGRMTSQLAADLGRSARQREVPLSRALALAVGSLRYSD